jgi:hypothetical protein
MNKVIGFTISHKEIDHGDIDIFNVGLQLLHFKAAGFNVYLWGIGNLKECTINDSYSLSFPLSNNLLDRNILITVLENSIEVENDWLGCIPVFYNKKELIVSTLSLKTFKGKDININGVHSFLRFGYSVYQETAYSDVKYLRYYSKLIVKQNSFDILLKDDPAKNSDWLKHSYDEADVLSSIKAYVNAVEKKVDGSIVLPTSAGFDSRLLNVMVNDKSRVKSYTYGVSQNQSRNKQVVYASKLAKILNTQWKHVEISSFYDLMPQWHKLFGFSVHLHGMFYIAFYKKIIEQNKNNVVSLLSGIIGDVWSGNVINPTIDCFEKLSYLGYTHGLALQPEKIVNDGYSNEKKFYNHNKEFLNDHRFALVSSMRMKLMLLCHLTQLPEYFGIPVWTPFLDFNIATKILCIPHSRWKGRKWQIDYFKQNKVWLEEMNLSYTKNNRVNFIGASNYKFEPIDPECLNGVVSPEDIDKINNILKKQTPKHIFMNKVMTTPVVKVMLGKLGVKDKYMQAVNEYNVIKAIDMSFKDNKL